MLKALHQDKVRHIYNRNSSFYDRLHNLGTYKLDQKGRTYLVEHTVKNGDKILDAGGGTGTTTFLALAKSGPDTTSVILDFSEGMLEKAREKAAALHFTERIETKVGDMYEVPYPNNQFDVVLSTYSTCPLTDPAQAVIEMVRVTRPGGLVGIAHSCEAENAFARKVSNVIERFIWLFPRLSMGCRNINLLPAIERMNVELVENKLIGFVPWYFRVLILKKV